MLLMVMLLMVMLLVVMLLVVELAVKGKQARKYWKTDRLLYVAEKAAEPP